MGYFSLTGLVPAHYRNGVATQFPQVWTDQSNTYQFALFMKRNNHLKLIKRRLSDLVVVQVHDFESDSVATTDGISPINTTEDANSSHYFVGGMSDDQDRVWIWGNSLSAAPHCIRGAAGGDITATWTSIPWPWTNYDSTASCTYHLAGRLADGTMLHCMSQRENPTLYPEGDRFFLMRLPLGTSTFQPCIGTDGWIATAPRTPPAGQATRVYVSGMMVTNSPVAGKTDRVWLWGNFRIDALDATTQKGFWFIYNDDVTNSATWKRMDGSSQTMPLTWPNSGAPTSGACIDVLQGSYSPFNSGFVYIDAFLHPHVILGEDSTLNRHHYWWNGTSWQHELANTSSSAPSIVSFDKGKTVHMIRSFGTPIPNNSNIVQNRISSILAGGTNFYLGGLVDNTGVNKYFVAYPDPIQLRRSGVFYYITPDGDNAKMMEIGKLTGGRG